MKFVQDLIIAPVITERSMTAARDKKYTFKVAESANKIEIKKAAEIMFPGIKVKSVNTMNVRGQFRRYGRNEGYTASWKKAVITLTEDSKTIEFFDGML
ncbi:MAG: 50S ribosomal protein L23 [Clostridia bacterium]|nr:50S ribosomal protein L23 [Clostridia bacterium]